MFYIKYFSFLMTFQRSKHVASKDIYLVVLIVDLNVNYIMAQCGV